MEYPILDSEVSIQKQDKSPWIIILSLLAFMILGMIIGTFLVYGLIYVSGMELDFLGKMTTESPLAERNMARWANLFPHLFAFTLSSLFCAWFFFKKEWLQKLQLQRIPEGVFLGAGVLFVMGIFPLAQTSYWINQQLPLPAWMKAMEDNANELVKILLHMDSPAELLLNLLTVGVVAAVGEELVFRGIIQQQLAKVFKNPITSIWVTAIIFSSIHMQFAGFLPRMILGAGLGYLCYWSRTLWMPILVHFLFNSAQVIAYYFMGEKADQFAPDKAIDNPNWLGGMLGLAVILAMGYYLSRLHKKLQP